MVYLGLWQGKLPRGATIVPIILASDKTKLSNFRGDQTAWPVYLSIGNIAKATRRRVSARATVLLGYIPVSKLECFSTAHNARRLAVYRLYHHCMQQILAPLIEAGKSGVEMLCADGHIRIVFPILAAYVADHPEQCLIVNVQENHCPRGTVDPDHRGEPDGCSLRSVEETLQQLNLHRFGDDITTLPDGLRLVYSPFWADLPHCDIFSCITPDILHQLLKGVFKDHLVSWITAVVGEEELDQRFKAMANVPGLRHFKKGILHVQQWTGTEYKEMQKVFVVLVAGAVDAKVLAVVQALIDFAYHAQLHLHTSKTLDALRKSLDTFHANKEVFKDLNIREHFNIAKIHAMTHYVEAILEKGSLDGYNTELSERLHIDFAKAGYRAGNRRDYIAHMTTWLERQEAVKDRFKFYEWLDELEKRTTTANTAEPLDTFAPVAQDSELDPQDNNDSEDPEDSDVRFLPSSSPRSYRIARNCPFKNVPLEQLQQDYRATEFLPALQAYIRSEFPRNSYIPLPRTMYNVYKRLQILQPWNPFVSSDMRLEKVRGIAPVASRGRQQQSPGYFDPVLAIEDVAKYKQRARGSLDGQCQTYTTHQSSHTADDSHSSGIRAARLHVIFELPPELGRESHPLAYIEWYTPFQRRDATTNLYQVSRSSRNRRANAEVVSVDRILGLCHLAPKCGSHVDRRWTSENVLDMAAAFFVNPYLSLHTFSCSSLYPSVCV
jgi:hypothetical protein